MKQILTYLMILVATGFGWARAGYTAIPHSESYYLKAAGLGEGGTGADMGIGEEPHRRRQSANYRMIDVLGQSLIMAESGHRPFIRTGDRRVYVGVLPALLDLENTIPTALECEGETSSLEISSVVPGLTAIFNHSDLTRAADRYRIQVARSEDFSDLAWESGVSGTAMAETAAGLRCPALTYSGDELHTDGTTYYWRIKFWDTSGNEGAWSETALFGMVYSLPTAPTELECEGAVEPLEVLDLTPEFTATFNDPEVGDTSECFQIEVSRDAGFGDLIWNPGQEWGEMAAVTAGERSSEISYGGDRLYTDGSQYWWRVRFRDRTGNESPWSAGATFTMLNSVPTGPTSLEVEGETAPEAVSTLEPGLCAVFNDPEAGDTAMVYQVVVYEAGGFSSPSWDSGWTEMEPLPNGESFCLNFPGEGVVFDGTTYYWQVRFEDAAGNEGEWSEPGEFTMADYATAPSSPDTLRVNGEANQYFEVYQPPVFTAIYRDDDATDLAEKYRIQVSRRSDFATVDWDSGESGEEMEPLEVGGVCGEIPCGGFIDPDGIYYWRIKFWDIEGYEGEWSVEESSFGYELGPTSSASYTLECWGLNEGGTANSLAAKRQADEPYYYLVDSVGLEVASLGPDGLPHQTSENFSVYSHVLFAGLDTTAPSSPEGLETESPTQERRPAWTWTQSTDNTFGSGLDLVGPYVVFWSRDEGGTEHRARAESSGYTPDEDLDFGGWYFTVAAVDREGNRSVLSDSGYVNILDTTPTPTPTPSVTPTPSPSPSITPIPSPSVTPTPSATPTPVGYMTPLTTPTPSTTPTATPSPSITPTATPTPSITPTATPTPSISPTPLGYKTATPTPTPSPTTTPYYPWSDSFRQPGSGVSQGGCENDPTNKRSSARFLLVDNLGFSVGLGDRVFGSFVPSENHLLISSLHGLLDTTVPSRPGRPETNSPTQDQRPTWTWTTSADNPFGSGLDPVGPYIVFWSRDEGGTEHRVRAESADYTPDENLGFGEWYFTVAAVDREGNRSALSDSGYVNILDTTPSPTPTPSVTPSPTVTPTPSPSMTPTPSVTPTVTPTAVPTATPDGGCKIDLRLYLHGYLNELTLAQRVAAVNVEFRKFQNQAGEYACDLNLDIAGRTGERDLWNLTPNSYYLLIRQKLSGNTFDGQTVPLGANHYAVVSAQPRDFVLGVVTGVDFSDSESEDFLGVYTSAHEQASNPMIAVGTSGRYWMLGGGDADGNQLINVADILKWDTLVGFPDADDRGEARFSEQGNFDGNDKIDGYDFNVWKRMVNEGATYAPLP